MVRKVIKTGRDAAAPGEPAIRMRMSPGRCEDPADDGGPLILRQGAALTRDGRILD